MTEAVTPPNPANPGGTRSVPDPTLMTLDSIRREIAMLELATDKGFKAAEDLTAERFRSLDVLMERSEELRREQKRDTKSAVDDALASQKEATAKMEKSISDQVTALQVNFSTEVRGIRASIDDLKEGVGRLESVKQGQMEQKTESRQFSAGVIALIGIGITVFLFGMAVIAFVAARAPMP